MLAMGLKKALPVGWVRVQHTQGYHTVWNRDQSASHTLDLEYTCVGLGGVGCERAEEGQRVGV